MEIEEQELLKDFTRRGFLKTSVFGCIGFICLGPIACTPTTQKKSVEQGMRSMILVNYDKCTGCRTCEAVCSAHQNQKTINGRLLPGLGNPHQANIRVHRFNPDVDVPSLCVMCPDAPCIEACPVTKDENTGTKALYRDAIYGTIRSDVKRCIGCESCVVACRNKSVGIISMNPVTHTPKRLCTLCNGEPQCVKYCPYDALSVVSIDVQTASHRIGPESIAAELMQKWYKI
jgi:Fe-S-cluster-containing hydrogenase component 2